MRNFMRSKLFIFAAVVIAVSSALLVMSEVRRGHASPISGAVQFVVMPFQSVINRTVEFVDGICKYFYDFDNLKEENEQLRAEINRLNAELRENDGAAAENRELREMIGLAEKHSDFSFAPAEIVGISTDAFRSCFTINKGSSDGIELYDCVITSGGMVGYISEVGAVYSTVSAIIDPELQCGAIGSKTREVAVAEGSADLLPQGMFKLSFLHKDSEIEVGDTIETSGLGQVFPRGLIMGTVEYKSTESDGMSDYAAVRPAVDLSGVKSVFVITEFEITD